MRFPRSERSPACTDAYVCGSVHSGYTSGPYIAKLLADRLLGREPELPLFPIDRLLACRRFVLIQIHRRGVMTAANPFHGIHAATVAPMRPDYSLDEERLAEHVGDVSRVPGIRGLLINGHAGENFHLTRDEARRVVEIVRARGAEGLLDHRGRQRRVEPRGGAHRNRRRDGGRQCAARLPAEQLGPAPRRRHG